MITQYDTDVESAAVRAQLKRVLTMWAARSKADLDTAEWHYHVDTQEDVLVVITRRRAGFRVTIQPMEPGAVEKRRLKQAAGG